MPRLALPAALALALVASWAGLGSYGLVEPSDARYAEIAREMFTSGDYLFPRLFGIHHFHKPPLIYWLTAAGYRLFGVNEWGARAVLGTLSVALCLVLWRFARRHLDSEAPPWAVACAATMPAVIAAGRSLTTDLLLAFLLTAALTSWYDVWSGRGGRWARACFYAALGLAFLAKGPVGWLLPALVLVPFALLHRGQKAAPRGGWGLAWGLPAVLALALPWYAWVAAETPGLLSYLLGGQIASRFREGGMGHPHSWFYYLGVLPALGLPWILLALPGWRNLRRSDRPLSSFLAVWSLAPPLFFSVPSTKLPLYPLLTYPALALLAAAHLGAPKKPGPLPLRLAAATAVLLGIGILVAAAGAVPLQGGDLRALPPEALRVVGVPVGAAFGLAGLLAGFGARSRPGPAAGLLAAALGFAPAWACTHGDFLPLHTAKPVALAAASALRPGDTLAEYRELTAGLPFYTGVTPLLADIARETQFEKPGYAEQRILDGVRLQALWAAPSRVIVATTEKRARDLPGARELARGGGYVLVANR